MNESVHLSKQFDEDLADLRTHVLEMGGLVESQIRSAVDAYATGETGVVKDVVENDHRVNEFEKLIDDHTIHVVAKRQPTASDLRLVMGVSKIVTDLERIGDEAVNLSERVSEMIENADTPVPAADIPEMARLASAMLHDALDAFVEEDADRALAVLDRDDAVDAIYGKLLRSSIAYMEQDSSRISSGMRVTSCAKYLERIADHATNIAEMVVYLVRGVDVRHKSSV